MEVTVENYIQKLRSHDWYHEWSDDPGVYRRGSKERDELRYLRHQLDENYSLWNQYAPEMFKVGSSQTLYG